MITRRERSSIVTLINYMLASLLAVSWSVSLYQVVELQRVVVDDEFLGRVRGSQNARQSEQVQGEARHTPSDEKVVEDDLRSSKDVHVVFSTDCSGYQHWQSIASYYSLRRAGHLGPVTRIASGCSPKQEESIRNEFQKIQQNSHNQLRLHFTPSFSLSGGGGRYKYSNKPGGLFHWIKNHTDKLEESVIALVDPDMMALRPVIPNLGEGVTPQPVAAEGYRNLVEYRDEHGRVLLLRKKDLPALPPRVTKGIAAGQHFGLGGMWASAGTPNARPDFRTFNLTAVCGAGSPCLNVPPKDSDKAYTTPKLADKSYAVGPVYIASASDWEDLLPRWHDFMPRVHRQYPKLLAEMFAYTMAAADMQLKFALSSSYMVSDPGTMSPTESWLWVDEYTKKSQSSDTRVGEEHRTLHSVCEGATSSSLPTETMKRLKKYGYGDYRDSSTDPPNNDDIGALPIFLHYCQNYKLAGHTFAKRKMSHDFFACNGSPLKLDAEAIMKELDSVESDSSLKENQRKKQIRTGFMLCHLIPLMNMALDDYKQDVC